MGKRRGTCELCGREVSDITLHHLIPRTRHRNRRNKRKFSRQEVRERTAWLCRPCHGTVHAELSEKELEQEFNTVPALAGHPGVARFVEWIRHRPEDTAVRVRRSRERSAGWSRAR